MHAYDRLAMNNLDAMASTIAAAGRVGFVIRADGPNHPRGGNPTDPVTHFAGEAEGFVLSGATKDDGGHTDIKIYFRTAGRAPVVFQIEFGPSGVRSADVCGSTWSGDPIRSPRLEAIARSIAEAAAGRLPDDRFSVDLSAPASRWTARFESPSSEAEAFGNSPEDAMRSLLDSWKRHADESYLQEYRADIWILPYEDRGYVLGTSDALWMQGGLNGDDERFDDILGDALLHQSRY